MSAYVSVTQPAVDARRRAQAGAVMAQRGIDSEARAARGLASVSTTCPQGDSAAFWDTDVLQIDRAKARLTRLRKAVGIGAKLLHNDGQHNRNVCMVMLTYAGDNAAWKPSHIRDYLHRVRKWLARKSDTKLRYVWVAELQTRGVIHYHAVFWLPKGLTMPKADKQGWWPHGWTGTKRATKPIGYLMKYASKGSNGVHGGFPHGARIHGVGGLDESGRGCRRWVLWPSYVQANAAAGDGFRPAQGGGYVNAETGELLRSDWAPTGGGFRSFVRIRRGPRAVDAAGPFSWLRPGVTVH